MVSRTTKQAARAYQKSHGVPYAEALRRVMQPESPVPADVISGDAGKRKGITTSSQPFSGLSVDRSAPVYIDPSAGLRSSDAPVVFNLGTGILGNTGFHPDSVPAAWTPARSLEDSSSATLGVYARGGEGKTVYLSTLARNHLAGVPTLVVTSFPQHFPEQEGMAFLDSRVVLDAMHYEEGSGEAAQEALHTFEEALDAAIATENPQVIIYDDGPEEILIRLIRRSRSEGAIILFSSLDVEYLRPGLNVHQPGSRIITPEITVMLNSAGARHPREGAWGGAYEHSWVRRNGYDPMQFIRPTP